MHHPDVLDIVGELLRSHIIVVACEYHLHQEIDLLCKFYAMFLLRISLYTASFSAMRAPVAKRIKPAFMIHPITGIKRIILKRTSPVNNFHARWGLSLRCENTRSPINSEANISAATYRMPSSKKIKMDSGMPTTVNRSTIATTGNTITATNPMPMDAHGFFCIFVIERLW